MLHVPAFAWVCHRSLEDAEAVWRELQVRGDYRVFQDYDWVACWYRNLGRPAGVEPRIVTGSLGGEVQILFPLGISKAGGLRRLIWLGDGWNDYNAPVTGPAEMADVLATTDLWTNVLKAAGAADLLEISKQAPEFANGRPNPAFLSESVQEDNSTHLLDLSGDPETLRAAIHSPRTWQNFDRKRRKLAKAGNLEFREETDPAERLLVIDAMLRNKSEELRAAGKRDPFAEAGAQAFIRDVVTGFPGIARLFTLRLDGRPIVTTLCLVERDALLLYQTTYDRAHGNASPGALLLHHIIFLAAREGYAVYDCLFGDDPYKLQICNRSLPLGRVLVPLNARGRIAKYLTMSRLLAIRQVKKSAVLSRTARRVNRVLGGLSSREKLHDGE